jgi:hypothetical protein
VQIKDFSQVKRVNGTKQNGGNVIYCLIFSTKDGTELAKVETSAGKPYDADFKIEDFEEIIGIYGHEYGNLIFQFGFIVWQPPHL